MKAINNNNNNGSKNQEIPENREFDVEINVIRWGSWEQSANLLRGRTKYAHCAMMYYATLAKIRRQRVAQAAEREAVNPSL